MKVKPKTPVGHSRSSKVRAVPPGDGAFQLKVVLAGSDPPIWRRIRVLSDLSLWALHSVLQAVMGWEDDHLHEFKIGKASYGSADEADNLFAQGMKADTEISLRDVLPAVTRSFEYIYDFGDDWIHDITVEEFLPAETDAPPAICLAGERACPPEDSGGVNGFYWKLEVLADPSHPEYENVKDWMGRYDPARFELDRVNARLKRVIKVT